MIESNQWLERRVLSMDFEKKNNMPHWKTRFFILGLTMVMSACATPGGLPAGPTPIPTLIPATEPSNLQSATAPPEYTVQSYPARLPSAELGEPLYQTHCASCHGEDGNGVVPGARNFGDLDYMRGETPASFYAAVTEGRGEMPAFRDRLTSDERWDVVAYVWSFSTEPENLVLGEHIYSANCAACHGEDGTGAVLGASDFTDLRLVDNQAPRDFYLTITQGIGSMPAWQGRLSQDERWAVIDYLRTFSYDPGLDEEAVVDIPPTSTPSDLSCTPEYLSQSNPFDWEDDATITAGQVIYDQACAACHGADGTGSIPGTSDFTTREESELLQSNSGEILCVVAEGRSTMPGWKETLTVEEMWQVITYLASLGAP
jgi:mono/diheme cytochrome c family protein